MIYLFLIVGQFMFSQNKIQYRQHKWLMHETEHFELYYYPEGKVLVPFAEDVLENQYDKYSERFKYTERENEKKIPVIIYKSHPDFEETNVIFQRIPESVGGFSEIFKKRIVLPFNGSYSEFRHILAHELVHIFQYRILYGSGIRSLQRMATLQVPLWFIEGMAELESSGWEESGEAYIRDALLNNRLFSIMELNRMGGYPIYKEGQSILYYLRKRYGEKKIGELLNKVKVTGSFRTALKQVLGIDEERLNKEWIRSLKKEYWPLIEDKNFVDKIARPLITHEGFKNIYNYAPAISPDGSKIVYYTDKEGVVQIRIVSILSGKDLGLLVKGGRTPKFESLHLMEGHLTFSPDGKNVAFSAKERGKDVLYIFNVKDRKEIERIDLPLDRIRQPVFSPAGSEIAFMGLRNGASDIYIYSLKSEELTNLTHDRYSDLHPVWKGDSIIFISDRPEFNDWDYEKENFYISDREGNIRKYLSFGGNLHSPVYFDSKLYFVSDRDGAKNLYAFFSDSGKVYQLTDIIGSIETISVSEGGKAALSVYNNIGWDVYMVDDLSALTPEEPNPSEELDKEYTEVNIDEIEKERVAPLGFGIDYVSGTLGYYSDYGLYGNLALGMSDMLGNHHLYALFDNTDLMNSNFLIEYLYLKHRMDYYLSLIRQRNYVLYGTNRVRGELWNLNSEIWFPLDRFNRFELGLHSYMLSGDVWQWTGIENGWEKVTDIESTYGVLGAFSFVKDNTIWGAISPVKGFRGRMTVENNLIYGDKFWEIGTVSADLRKYWYLADNWNFATRLLLLHSWGRDRVNFSTVGLGGGRSIRGYEYNSIVGTTAGFINFELRFPLIKRLELGIPPISFGQIDGALFVDIGGATYNFEDFQFATTQNNWVELVDAKMSFGLETRLNLGITMFNFTISKRTNLNDISRDTYYDVYLGFPF